MCRRSRPTDCLDRCQSIGPDRRIAGDSTGGKRNVDACRCGAIAAVDRPVKTITAIDCVIAAAALEILGRASRGWHSPQAHRQNPSHGRHSRRQRCRCRCPARSPGSVHCAVPVPRLVIVTLTPASALTKLTRVLPLPTDRVIAVQPLEFVERSAAGIHAGAAGVAHSTAVKPVASNVSSKSVPLTASTDRSVSGARSSHLRSRCRRQDRRGSRPRWRGRCCRSRPVKAATPVDAVIASAPNEILGRCPGHYRFQTTGQQSSTLQSN